MKWFTTPLIYRIIAMVSFAVWHLYTNVFTHRRYCVWCCVPICVRLSQKLVTYRVCSHAVFSVCFWQLIGGYLLHYCRYVFDHPQLAQYFNVAHNTKITPKMLQQEENGTSSAPRSGSMSGQTPPPSPAASAVLHKRSLSIPRSPGGSPSISPAAGRRPLGEPSFMDSSGAISMDGIDLSGLSLTGL